MQRKKPVNPFYMLLLAAGCAFAITATAYGVMTVRQLHQSRARWGADVAVQDASFNRLVDQHGVTAMLAELVLLAIGTVGAIAYDQRLDTLSKFDNAKRSDEKTCESTTIPRSS